MSQLSWMWGQMGPLGMTRGKRRIGSGQQQLAPFKMPLGQRAAGQPALRSRDLQPRAGVRSADVDATRCDLHSQEGQS